MPNKEIKELKFANTESERFYVNAKTVAALIIPDDVAFDGKTFTFKVGMDREKLFILKNSLNADITVTISKASVVALDIQNFSGLAWIQIISSDSLDGKFIEVIYREI